MKDDYLLNTMTAEKMLKIPREDWATLQLPWQLWPKIEEEADAAVQAYALLAFYAGNRGGFRCGDSGHEEALAAAHTKLKQIRQILGYRYP